MTDGDVAPPEEYEAMELSTEDLLAFEASNPGRSLSKEELIRTRFGVSPARYFQLLFRAAFSLDGARTDAMTARRVRDRWQRSLRPRR